MYRRAISFCFCNVPEHGINNHFTQSVFPLLASAFDVGMIQCATMYLVGMLAAIYWRKSLYVC
jgi:hypothetical protein